MQQIAFCFDFDDDPVMFSIREQDAQRLFGNLLSNALRYTPEGGKIIIKFDINSSKDDFEFSVTNYGPIIPRDELPYVFDRFYRVKQVRLRQASEAADSV